MERITNLINNQFSQVRKFNQESTLGSQRNQQKIDLLQKIEKLEISNLKFLPMIMTMLDIKEKAITHKKIQEFNQHQMLDGILKLDTPNLIIQVMSIHTKEDKMSLLLEFLNRQITLNMLLQPKSRLIWTILAETKKQDLLMQKNLLQKNLTK